MESEGNRKMEGLGGLRAHFNTRAGLPDRLCRQYRHPFDVPCWLFC